MDAQHVQNPSQIINQLQALNRENKQRVFQLHNLVDISFQLNSFFEEDKIIRTYLLNLFGLLSTKSIVVVTSDVAQDERFEASYVQGVPEQQAKKLRIRKDDTFLTFLKQRRQIVLDRSKKPQPARYSYLHTVNATGGTVITSVVYRDILLGLVIVGEKFNGQPYSEWELEILSLLTNFLAMALSNARIYKHMERVSLTDPLTGLFNRRYFENFLQKEISRAKRFNHPLSLVLMDIDHFKNYNDQLGHPSGDQLLKRLAKVMTDTVRRSDFVARYGGEEFGIILPEIHETGAQQFSERLRRIVNTHPFKNRRVQPAGRITVSLGAASFPKDAQRVEDLVKKADTALYHAKKNGRNQVVVYNPQIDL